MNSCCEFFDAREKRPNEELLMEHVILWKDNSLSMRCLRFKRFPACNHIVMARRTIIRALILWLLINSLESPQKIVEQTLFHLAREMLMNQFLCRCYIYLCCSHSYWLISIWRTMHPVNWNRCLAQKWVTIFNKLRETKERKRPPIDDKKVQFGIHGESHGESTAEH